MVITREYLTRYAYLESYIKSVKRRLKYYETHPLQATHGVVTGSRREFPYIQCHFVISAPSIKSDEERKMAINQLKIDLAGNQQLYEDMQMDIECFIEGLKDIEDKTILRLKYIDRLTDEQIGRELGYDRSSISKKIDKILEKVQVSHNSQP
ncbi:MAG: DUF1492 domain-containing protein [Lachnospiraceae bacterium]|nr:DUF1492 domain-containing protein [Lachnospiraceae bacterium]DAL28415.1 MAG TPA_asm: RNA polymerase sigma factor [Caudoviricetes sp.]